MSFRNKESGQALFGGIFFILLVMLISWYFIFIVKSIKTFYSDTLTSRFEMLKTASEYAQIFNQISINNQNIVASIMSVQVAYIKGVEFAIGVSYEQPYWETYQNLKNTSEKGPLSKGSATSIETKFKLLELKSSQGFMVAKALAHENELLIKKLPNEIRVLLSQSTNNEIHTIALEALSIQLQPSHYTSHVFPSVYKFGLYKNGTQLEHKRSALNKIMSTALPILTTNEDNFVVDFTKIDSYSGKNFSFKYGITYVKPEIAPLFFLALKSKSISTLKSTVRIIHPLFSCDSVEKHKTGGDFIVEKDWFSPCEISKSKFLQAFFKPFWTAIITEQDMGLKT